MYSNHIFSIADLPRGLGLNFFSLVEDIPFSGCRSKHYNVDICLRTKILVLAQGLNFFRLTCRRTISADFKQKKIVQKFFRSIIQILTNLAVILHNKVAFGKKSILQPQPWPLEDAFDHYNFFQNSKSFSAFFRAKRLLSEFEIYGIL